MASTVMIALADGRRFETRAENGMLKPGELEDKFRRVNRPGLGAAGTAVLFERLQRLEDETDLSWLGNSAVARPPAGKGSTGRGKHQSHLGRATIASPGRRRNRYF
jgi:hypothetical protein